MGRNMTRIDDTFARLKSQGKKAFVSYIMAGDPDIERSLAVMKGLPGAGVDIIELGLPFTDPMADGPTIQLAGQRALDGGMTLDKTLQMVRDFRAGDALTPIVLMGYYNPIYSRGVDLFLTQAKEAGIDGLIVVDLPPEEDDELCIPAQAAGLNFIRLATPTTDAKRLPTVLQNTSGFVYYVSITGITGAAAAQAGLSEAFNTARASAGAVAAIDAQEANVGVIANANGGARAYPMQPYMGLLHTALSAELADFIAGKEEADQALADVKAAYDAAAKEGGFLK